MIQLKIGQMNYSVTGAKNIMQPSEIMFAVDF